MGVLCADDLAAIADIKDLIKRLNGCKDFVENRGMTVNVNKTTVMISGERQKVTNAKGCKMAMLCLW